MKFYLQFGQNTGPFQTVAVEHKEKPLPHHKAGLQYTATGYGSKIPTRYMIRFENRWRRVYVACFSNVGTAYVFIDGEKVTVEREGA
ncbi:hypothetical protein [Marinobacter nauticus]|uniref:Uncharacterized protein n=1 Tax=Marinobacter nauticus TaxID=2743 RepID=A0A833JS11_MARNT|nr:hypothetical protein [Marinobacter nauticus]KAE8546183.1 hypothetical protein F6453_1429 [Marinobacter nauticus]